MLLMCPTSNRIINFSHAEGSWASLSIEREPIRDTRGSGQETPHIRPQGIPFDHRRWRKIATFSKKQTIFVQGDSSDAVFYIREGKVKHTVVSQIGKEATIGILNKGDFFGEGCLTGQPLRMCTATAMTDCTVTQIDKKSMMEVLHREHAFPDMFVAYLLTRNIRYEEDLVDRLTSFSIPVKKTGAGIAIAGSFRQGR
jgi:CRP-like cAMP-binding protein